MTKNKEQPAGGKEHSATLKTGLHDAAIAADPFSVFEVARNVTLPLLKQAEGERVAIAFISNIYLGRELKTARGGAERRKPAHLAKIVNLLTGELMSYICATFVKSELMEGYPSSGYVGKAFVIKRGPTKQGAGTNKYNTYDIQEVKVPAGIKLPASEVVADMSIDTDKESAATA